MVPANSLPTGAERLTVRFLAGADDPDRLFGVLTANIAAFFVEQDQEDDPMIAKVNDMLERLDRIEKALAAPSEKARVDRVEDFG